MINKIQNPTTLHIDDKPKPKVIRINKLALIIFATIIVLVFIVAIFALDTTPHNTNLQLDTTHDTVVNENDKEWYQRKPNAVHLQDMHNNAIEKQDDKIKKINAPENDIEKLKSQAYLEAIDSSLAPSGVGLSENQQINTQSNTLDTATRKLPLSDAQIAKLAEKFGDKDYLHESVLKPVSKFEIQAGTKIPAVLEGGINSDLPGQATAIVRQNVYDTVTGKYLLIPQGSKLIIIYDSNIAFGQERVLPTVKRIIMPNGNSINLEGMPGADQAGYAGFNDQVNNHYQKIFGSALVLAGLSAGFQLSQPQQSSALANPSAAQIAAGAVGQQMTQVGTMLMTKNMNIQPTLEIRPGYEFIVNVTADIVFPAPYK